MTLFVFFPVLVFAIIALKAFKYIRPIFRARGKINAEVTGRLTETLNGIRVIKGFNAEEQEKIVFEKGVEELYNNVKKSLNSYRIYDKFVYFFIRLSICRDNGDGRLFYNE
jgi:subfamily B ATP-binding cassette protein MsbA